MAVYGTMRNCALAASLLACSGTDSPSETGETGETAVETDLPPDTGSSDTGGDDTATDDTGDTGDTDDGELVWEGDLAVYDKCTATDPAALLLSQTIPSTPLTAGASVSAEFVFANCSYDTWVAAKTDSEASGVKLGAVAETVMETWSRARTKLPADVPPGYAVRIQWEGVAPLTNGEHRWVWQLVDEWVAWLDAPTPEIELEVTGGYGPFVLHTRDEWELSSQPVDGPAMDLLDLRYIVIHYNGATADLDGSDDIYTDEDTILSLRNSQAYYLSSRGYSLGYNSEIAPDGDEWEIRGYDIRSAANGCTDVNRPGYAIQIPTVNPDADPTPAQVEGARAAILRIRRAAAAAGNPNFLSIVGHGDVRPLCSDGAGTACPGTPLKTLMAAGSLEP